MKIKSLILGCCLSLCTTAFAGNQHVHPLAESIKNRPIQPEMKWPGPCQIEIINQSYDDIRVFGMFDDGTTMRPFNVYAYEAPQYISLEYYGYCHAGMDLDIDSFSGYHLYGGYTRRESSIRIFPYLANKAKAQVTVKSKSN